MRTKQGSTSPELGSHQDLHHLPLLPGGLAPGWSQQQQLCDVTAPVQHMSTTGTWEDKQNTEWVVGSELRSHPFLRTLLPSEKAGAKQPSVSWTHQAVYLEWGRIASSGTRSENEDNLHCLCLPLLHSRPPTAPRSVRRSLLSKPSQGEGLKRVEVPGARPNLRSHAHKTCPPRL